MDTDERTADMVGAAAASDSGVAGPKEDNVAGKAAYEYNSDDDENDENWPMWSRVYDPRARAYYYFNNFDASCVVSEHPPDDYSAPDVAHEQAAPPSHAEWLRLGHARRGASIVELYHDPFLEDLPKPMAQLIAAQRIQSMARARQGRKRARAKKAAIEFARYEALGTVEHTADDSAAALMTPAASFAHSKG